MASHNDSGGCRAALAILFVLVFVVCWAIQTIVGGNHTIGDWAVPQKILAGVGGIVLGLVLSLWGLKRRDPWFLLLAAVCLVPGAVALVWGAIQLYS
jgi:hypothetical protein